jgi:hypothetical protein
MDSGLLAALTGAAALIIGAGITWLSTRRTASGRIATSEAGVLWEQAQAMRAELVTRLDKVTEQRDRLIESQSASVLPALDAITASLEQITGSLARLEHGDGHAGAAAGTGPADR